MDENIKQTIDSLKSVIETTQKQLEQMRTEKNPNKSLMAAVQDNHDRAINILQLMSDINTKDPFDRSEKVINVTHDVNRSFQVIPPAEQHHDNLPENKKTEEKNRNNAVKLSTNSEEHMTRAEYRALLKKQHK